MTQPSFHIKLDKMTSKALQLMRHSLCAFILVGYARAGLLLYGKDGLCNDDLRNHHATHHEVSLAKSFVHFHGPVEGPVYEIKVPYVDPRHYLPHREYANLPNRNQEHEDYVSDYIAHPKYEFSYNVEDHRTGDFHGQKESRDGSGVAGEYSVLEPGGSVRIVSYQADKDGFRAVVRISDKEHYTDTYDPNKQTHGDKAMALKFQLENAQRLRKYDNELRNAHQLQHESRQVAANSAHTEDLPY